jgi:hypothetical protein
VSDLRGLIIEWVRVNKVDQYWVMDLFRHLTRSGVDGEDALTAMCLFMDEAIAIKKSKQHERPSVGD